MSWPQAFFYSVLALAIAVVVGSLSPVIAQQARGGGYMVASDGGPFVWRVNTGTGAVSYCSRRDSSLDPKTVAARRPTCSNPSQAAE